MIAGLKLRRFLAFGLLACGSAAAQSTVWEVWNAASGVVSNRFSQNPGPRPLAAGSLVQAGVWQVTAPPPPSLDPAAVTLHLIPAFPQQSALDLPVLGAGSPSSVLALLPADVPLGPASLHLLVNGAEQAVIPVTIVSANFGLFTNGPVAIAQNTSTGGSMETNALTRPARPNQSITLWGSGLGTAGTPDVRATVGSRPVPVTYAGHSAMPGLDQINLQIPNDPEIPEGCYVAVEVSVNLPGQTGAGTTETSNRASISFARTAAQPCAHPFNLTAGEMQTLDQGGTIPLLTFGMSSFDAPNPSATGSLSPTRSDYAGASAYLLDAAGIAAASVTSPVNGSTSGGMLEASSASFGCQSNPSFLYPEPPFHGGLSAGPALSLTGPVSQALSLPATGTFYSYNGSQPVPPPVNSPDAVPDSFFAPSSWTLSSPGGKDILPFSVPLVVTPAIRIANADALTLIDTSQDVVVKWNTQGLTANQVVTVSLLSTVPCTAPAMAGSLTIPAALLLPNVTLPAAAGPWIEATLFPQPGPQSVFRVPRSDGTSIPAVFVQRSVEDIVALIEPPQPAIFANGIRNQDGTANGPSNGAASGSVIAIWATGLSGNVAVSGSIGGQDIPVPAFAGPAPGLAGVEQVNLLVPTGLASGTTQVVVCRAPSGGAKVCSTPVPFTVR
ncbi:MAG TPA: hypothetical protein VGN17_24465 [Bryobacteraceae bacterium]|jgi:uncharacterized protein (TIGR03437 family)